MSGSAQAQYDMNIGTILVPTDGSVAAHKAVELASDIAVKYGAGIALLHVTLRGRLPTGLRQLAEAEQLGSDLATPFVAGDNIPASLIAAVRGTGAARLSRQDVADHFAASVLREASRIVEAKGVGAIETALVDGDPTRCILDHADRTGADLIVMGSRGLGDLRGLLMGSVSHKVTRLARCTCIAVK